MSVNSKMTAMANSIRALLGLTGTMGLDAMATHIGTEKTNVDNALTAIADKGVEVPSGANSGNLAELIASITGGGGSSFPNGTDWSDSNITTTWEDSEYDFREVLNANGIWVACCNETGVWYSEDGRTWTQSNFTSRCFGISFGKGVWVAAASTSRYSTDGKTWTTANNADGTTTVTKRVALDRVFYGGGRFIGFGSRGELYSDDGKTWHNGVITSNKQLRSATWADGLWVGDFYNAGQASLSHSADGLNWTECSINDNNGNYFVGCLCYAEGLWVYASEAGNGLFYSSDGITWMSSNITSGIFYVVKKLNGIWIAGGETGDGLYYSLDGKVWTQSNLANDAINYAYAENGVFVAVGSTTYYSTDGMVWHEARAIPWVNYIYYAHGMWVLAGSGLYYSIGWEPS